MTSASAFAAKCHRYATLLPETQKRANLQASAAIKLGWLAAARIGPNTRLGRGYRVGVRYDQKGAQNPTTLVRFYGPVHWLESNTKQHLLVPRKLATRGGARKRAGRIGAGAAFGGAGANRGVFGAMRDTRGAQALTIGGDLRAYAFHPGTKGRNFWPKCKQIAYEVGPRVHKQATGTQLLKTAGFG